VGSVENVNRSRDMVEWMCYQPSTILRSGLCILHQNLQTLNTANGAARSYLPKGDAFATRSAIARGDQRTTALKRRTSVKDAGSSLTPRQGIVRTSILASARLLIAIGSRPNAQPCEICGEPCSRKGAHICSDDACKKERERRRSREYGVASKTALPRKCKECGTIFTPEYGDKRKVYCSHKCGKKAGKRKGKKHTGTLNNVTRKRLRAMYGDSWRSMYEPINKRRVFERDRWRCQLCGCKVKRTTEWDPRQATIDHIIPLSLGGEHKYTNVQTACMECNSKKGATIQGQQRLFG